MKKIENLAYGSHPSQVLDLFLPDKESFPLFVYFHGGGLEGGDKSGFARFAPYLLSKGIAVASVNYRMYPEAKYPEFICDAASAVSFLSHHLSERDGCLGIFVGGSSAGGYLSMMLAFDDSYFKAVGFSPENVKGYLHDAGQPTAHFNVLRERGLDTRRIIVDESAPLFHIGKRTVYPPMHFIVSDNDMKNRYEQTMLTLGTLSHFGVTSPISHTVMHGRHCAYTNQTAPKDTDGEYPFAKIIARFIEENL